MTITAKLLERMDACKDQVAVFRELFSEGAAPMSVDVALQYADRFDWDWAAKRLLKGSERAEYNRVRALALAEYNSVKASARDEYGRVTAPARAEYDRVRASARAEYDRVKASTFARLYIEQEGKEK